MLSPKINEFVTSVLAYVKSPFDRRAIQAELENHLADKIDYLSEQGVDAATAEQLAIEAMGDAREIGIELNKVHHPMIGWLWKITNLVVIAFVLVDLLFLLFPSVSSVGNLFRNPVADIPKSDIIYSIAANKRVQLDDTVIRFTNVVLEKNGDMDIFYYYYDTKLWGTGWSLSTIGDISDNRGTQYISGSGSESGGIISSGVRTVNNFSKEADTLIITYDHYNRKYRVEIPLKELSENE